MDGELLQDFMQRISAAKGHGDPTKQDQDILAVVMDAYQTGLDEGRAHATELVRAMGDSREKAGLDPEKFQGFLDTPPINIAGAKFDEGQ